MRKRFELKVQIRAILDRPEQEGVLVTLPAGAILVRRSQSSEDLSMLSARVEVYWENRRYLVHSNDLARKAECLEPVELWRDTTS